MCANVSALNFPSDGQLASGMSMEVTKGGMLNSALKASAVDGVQHPKHLFSNNTNRSFVGLITAIETSSRR